MAMENQKNLKNYYNEIANGTFIYRSEIVNKEFSAKGLGSFFSTGITQINAWHPIKEYTIGNVLNNIKNTFRQIMETRRFLGYASGLITGYVKNGIDLNINAGKNLLTNLAALPKETQVWFTTLQTNYSKALESYIKSIQCEMVASVDRLRANINRAVRNVDKNFKKLLKKASDDIQAQLKDFQTQVKNIKDDFNNQVKDIKNQLTQATTDFRNNLKIVNDEITNARKSIEKITKDVTNIKEWSKEVETRIKSLEKRVKLPSAPTPTEAFDPNELLMLPQKYLDKLLS